MTRSILPDRSVLVLDGPDTIALLERLVTNNTKAWETGEARYGALLTPQGKIIADFIAHRTDTGAHLDVATHAVGDLSNRLKLFRLRAKVEIDCIGKLAVAIDDSAPADPRSADLPGRLIVEIGSAPDLSAADWDAIRIPAGVAEWGRDYTGAEVFPWEINMDRMNGVDLKKGCFVGQEVVSRTHRKGKIRKRTVVIEGANLQPGSDVMATTSLGTITSATPTHALARLRIDRLAKAEADDVSLSVDEKPVRLIKPDWLAIEMAASLPDGNEPVA